MKMAHDRANRTLAPERIVPEKYSWKRLVDAHGDQLESEYASILTGLSREDGVVGTIFWKAQNRLLTDFKLHTMLRLPTGISYANGVKANPPRPTSSRARSSKTSPRTTDRHPQAQVRTRSAVTSRWPRCWDSSS